MSRAAMAAAAMVALLGLGLAGEAAADPVRVGVFVPATPFQGTAARLDFATKLATHLGGADAVGKVYGQARDFASALKKGEIDLAVVDATYLAAAGGSYTVLAVAVRGGDTRVAWELVSRTGGNVLGLKDKTVLVPSVGGRERDFVFDAMLGGELPDSYFKVSASPDARSAVAALGLGKADAAVVPGGLELPAGVQRVATLSTVSWPVLIAAPGTPAALHTQASSRAVSFAGSGAISGFRAGSADAYKSLARRFGRAVRRGPMVVPNLRIAVSDLVAGRSFSIPVGDARQYAAR